MKITIDTQSDSKGDIKEVIQLLQNVLRERGYEPDDSYDDKGDDFAAGGLGFMDTPEEVPEKKEESEFKTIIIE